MSSIISNLDQIILSDDSRGVATLVSRKLPPDNTLSAARRLLPCRRVLICTGFVVAGRQETDGPPGAVALAECLHDLGAEVGIACGESCLRLLEACTDAAQYSVPFPVVAEADSTSLAQKILAEFRPDCLISIECCGRTGEGRYLNMRGEGICGSTPKVDALFLEAARRNLLTIGIGDGGNEIGFGKIDPLVLRGAGVDPCVVPADELVVAAVSNWGAYALIAGLSLLKGVNLLPPVSKDRGLLRKMVRLGAVDGFTGQQVEKVDGFSLDANAQILERLHRHVAGFMAPADDEPRKN